MVNINLVNKTPSAWHSWLTTESAMITQIQHRDQLIGLSHLPTTPNQETLQNKQAKGF